MICGVGLDLVDVAAFRGLVGAKNARTRFVSATFSAAELRYCEEDAHGDAVVHLAVRFAAKEATLKALDAAAAALGLSPASVPLNDVEVARDDRGRPTLALHGSADALARALEVKALHLSLSHDGNAAGAVVIAER